MPHNRPRVDVDAPRSWVPHAMMLLVIFGLGFLAMRSGAIEALNASGLFRG